jgi:AmmeMemoRadiSam system protein B
MRPLQIIPVQDKGRQFLLVQDPMGVLPGMAALPPDPVIIAILQHADGINDVARIAEEARNLSGLIVTADKVRHVLKEMDEALLLFSETFRDKWQERQDEYRKQPVRPYRCFDAKDRLLMMKQLGDEFRRHRMGRNSPPEKLSLPPGNSVRAILAPHIDYKRGGETYAWAYQAIEHHTRADTYIVLGTLHRPASHLFIATDKNYDTPFGTVETDRALLTELQSLYPHELMAEDYLHADEHTIELQAVYLKRVLGDRPFKILPILVGSIDEYLTLDPPAIPHEIDEELATMIKALRTLLERHGEKVVLIGGVDMAHCGPEFGDPEANSPEIEQAVRTLDEAALSHVETINATGFFESFRPSLNERKVCSIAPIYTVLAALEGTNLKGHRLAYQQSNSTDRNTMVTFASVAFAPDKPASRIILTG